MNIFTCGGEGVANNTDCEIGGHCSRVWLIRYAVRIYGEAYIPRVYSILGDTRDVVIHRGIHTVAIWFRLHDGRTVSRVAKVKRETANVRSIQIELVARPAGHSDVVSPILSRPRGIFNAALLLSGDSIQSNGVAWRCSDVWERHNPVRRCGNASTRHAFRKS